MRKWISRAAIGLTVPVLGIIIWQLDLPSWQKLDPQRILEIPESTLVYDVHGEKLGALWGDRARVYADLSEIPEDVIAAFITAEDQRFYQHSGIDAKRIFGALWHDIKTLSLQQGASTITQQLIKLTHLSSEKTLSRKVQEAVLALRLEKIMGKDEILQAYLNTVYFGSGAYGIGTAARTYFGKDASQLTAAEGALLAGVIKSPSNYAPHLHPENALKRRNSILASMRENGFLTAGEYDLAIDEKLQLQMQEASEAQYGWYMDQVMLEAEEALDMDVEQILSSGLHIHTALNPAIQQQAEALFANGANFPDPAADGTPAQAALIAMDTQSGGIAAIIGGREYAVRRGLNRASQMLRQPGSAIKPVSTYAAAIEFKGFLPTSTVQDVQREFPGKYLPGNAGGRYYGTVTLREALSRSLNVATVDLAELIGLQNVRTMIARFSLPLSAQDVNLSLCLGSMTHGVSPSKLCAAYCTLANGGMRVQPHAITRITDRRGKILYEVPEPGERAIRPETAFLVSDMLKTAAESGSASALADCGMPVMGKTGTVGEEGSGNRDIWTAAATPELAVTVWMGFDEPDSGHAIADWAGGSTYPAQLCANLLKAIRPELSGRDFTVPEGLQAVRIDAAALQQQNQVLLAPPGIPEEYVQTEYFPADKLPDRVSDLWDAPQMVDDLTLLSGKGEAPAIAFTARDSAADYLVLRRSGDETEIAAILSGNAGDVIFWTDPEADPNAVHRYSVLPRHRLLYESGTLLTGPESREAVHSPGGLLSRIFGTAGA